MISWLSKIFAFLVLSISFTSTSFAEIFIGTVEVTDQSQNISISGFTDPVIIVGVPTFNEEEAGVVAVSNVTSSSFDIQFKEWSYLDGVHAMESVPYLVIERGRHLMDDGSIWEAQTFEQSKGSKQIFFQESFSHVPQLLLTPQTQNETDTFVTRAWSLNQQAFSSNLAEQESGNDHGNETIGYLAIYKDTSIGELNSGNQFLLNNETVNQKGFTSYLGTVIVQEEQSLDEEVEHYLEMLNIVTIDNLTFATDVSRYGSDTISLRFKPLALSELKLEPAETSGSNNNIALIGTNNLTETSYTASTTYGSDSPSGGFDGWHNTAKINDDAGSKIKRGIWLTTNSAADQWLQVDFQRQAYITGFGYFMYASANDLGMGAKDITLQVSDDNVIFRDHESFTLPRALTNSITLTNPAIARYYRLVINATQGHNYKVIGELEYYGSFLADGAVVEPVEPTEPVVTENTTCETIKNATPLAASGIYQIDPDGENGLEAFDAYCDMETQGGGWTLVAHHSDGLESLTTTSIVDNASYSVLEQDKWQAIRNAMTTGMMFRDENELVSRISKDKLDGGNCLAITETFDLANPPIPYDIAVIWQNEGTGCSSSGLDYSFISLSLKSTSRANGYLTIGAALYQHNVKFDLWPYTDGRYSGGQQNQLRYFVK